MSLKAFNRQVNIPCKQLLINHGQCFCTMMFRDEIKVNEVVEAQMRQSFMCNIRPSSMDLDLDLLNA